MGETRIGELLSVITERNPLQAKALDGLEASLSAEEQEGLDALIAYYVRHGDTVEHLADCYLAHVQDFMEEEYYFIKNGHYRYSSSEEVNRFFYQDPSYMEYYMKGLAVSAYLLGYHRQCRAWFKERIRAQRAGGVYIWTLASATENILCWQSTTRIMSSIWASTSPLRVCGCAGRW